MAAISSLSHDATHRFPREIRAQMNVSRERMGRLMDVSAKTIERWEARSEMPDNRLVRQRMEQIREIANLGLTVYERAGFDLFLTTPMAVFGGHTALQLIEIGRGEEVIAALAADYEGLGF